MRSKKRGDLYFSIGNSKRKQSVSLGLLLRRLTVPINAQILLPLPLVMIHFGNWYHPELCMDPEPERDLGKTIPNYESNGTNSQGQQSSRKVGGSLPKNSALKQLHTGRKALKIT